MNRTIFFFALLGLSLLNAQCFAGGQGKRISSQTKKQNPDKAEKDWVDSVYNQLNEQERIGQLFMVAAYSNGKNYNKSKIEKLLKAHQIGGIIFMQGTPKKQALLTNEYQHLSQVPLLIGMDGEWGLGMRLTGVKDFPKQMTLGATQNPKLVYQMGTLIAQQCKRMGVQIDFAPDVDVNNNPKNPVIDFRSFGQMKRNVARLGIAYMKGLQDHGIMACAKHFPGHGDVTVDSHKDLPVIDKSLQEIDTLELYPFRKMIQAGVKCIMVAHLDVPALDNTPHLPTTLSKKVVTGLVRKKMGFDGLIITDALNMKGVTKYFPNGETDLKAFLAGNDILLFSQDVPLAIKKIENAIDEGKATKQDLEQRVKKILRAKYEAGLNHFTPINTHHLLADLNANTHSFWRKAASQSITLVKDENNLISKINQKDAKVAYFNIDVRGYSNAGFVKMLQAPFPNIKVVSSTRNLSQYNGVIIGIHHLNKYPGHGGRYGLSSQQVALIKKISKKQNVCFVVFGNAYLMKFLCHAGTVIVAYEDKPATMKAAQWVLGEEYRPTGKLPVLSCQ